MLAAYRFGVLHNFLSPINHKFQQKNCSGSKLDSNKSHPKESAVLTIDSPFKISSPSPSPFVQAPSSMPSSLAGKNGGHCEMLQLVLFFPLQSVTYFHLASSKWNPVTVRMESGIFN